MRAARRRVSGEAVCVGRPRRHADLERRRAPTPREMRACGDGSRGVRAGGRRVVGAGPGVGHVGETLAGLSTGLERLRGPALSCVRSRERAVAVIDGDARAGEVSPRGPRERIEPARVLHGPGPRAPEMDH